MKPPLFSCLTSRIAKNGSLYGRFLFGPLPIDISLTIATVLRRSLLHSQATFNIVSAEIDGADHEYASLPGIQESVLEILLNLAEIVLTSTRRNFISPNFRNSIGWSEEPSTGFYFAFIRVAGPGVVTAKDIHWPKGVFCVKPDLVIATLSSNETLTMRLKIACSLNKTQHSHTEIETHVAKSITSENNKDLIKRSGPSQNTDIESTFNILNSNKKGQDKQFFTNKNAFESFKLQGKRKTKDNITSVHLSDVKTYRSTLSSSQFLIKKTFKTLLSRKTRASKKANTLVFEETKQKNKTLTLLANQTKSLDSYGTRKNNLTTLSFSTITDKQTIFNENESVLERSISNYDKKKEKEEQNSVTFLVFPGVFNHFIDLSSIKKEETSFNVFENAKSRNYEPYELDTFSKTELETETKTQELRQQNSLFNTETNPKSFPLPPKKNKQKSLCKIELPVSSSSYPVEKVNFLIERDDELAGYRHRIILEVWTNGSISPRQAIFESIGSIIKLIYNFREPYRNSFNQNEKS